MSSTSSGLISATRSRWRRGFLRLFSGATNELGRIAPGHFASLVHLDDDLRVLETWIEGRPTADGSRAQ